MSPRAHASRRALPLPHGWTLGVALTALAVRAGADPALTPPAPPKADAAPAPAAATAASAEAAAEDPQRLTAHEAHLFLKVSRPEESQAAIIAHLDRLEGIALLRSQARLELKVPPQHLEALIATIEGEGQVLDKRKQRQDRTLEIARLAAQLQGRRTLMAQMRTFLTQADAGETGRIEWQLLQLLTETEGLANQLRTARDRVRYARVTIELQWQSSAPMRYGRAPFDWLDSTGIDQVLTSFGSHGGRQ